MPLRFYLYTAIAIALYYGLQWLIDKIVDGTSLPKDTAEGIIELLWKWVPLMILRIVIPYLLAYTALAIYCILWFPSVARVEELKGKIRSKILPG